MKNKFYIAHITERNFNALDIKLCDTLKPAKI